MTSLIDELDLKAEVCPPNAAERAAKKEADECLASGLNEQRLNIYKKMGIIQNIFTYLLTLNIGRNISSNLNKIRGPSWVKKTSRLS
jgi:hypothetical protein